MTVTSEVQIAIVSAIVTIALAFFKLLVEIRRTHNLVNSRMTELLELTKEAATAKGELAARSGDQVDAPREL